MLKLFLTFGKLSVLSRSPAAPALLWQFLWPLTNRYIQAMCL